MTMFTLMVTLNAAISWMIFVCHALRLKTITAMVDYMANELLLWQQQFANVSCFPFFHFSDLALWGPLVK